MGVRPLPPKTSLRALVACSCLAVALLLTSTSASGKKPPPGQVKHGLTAPTRTAGGVTAPQSAAGWKGSAKHGKGHNRVSRMSSSAPGGTAAAAPVATGATAAPHSASTSGGAKRHRARAHGKRHRASSAAPRRATTRAPSAALPRAPAPAARGVQRSAHRRAARRAPHRSQAPSGPRATVIRTFDRVVRVVPAALKAVIVALAFLLLVAALAYSLLARTTRYLARQRKSLLGEIGVLQEALLPDVPDEIGGLRPSVAYRPADGPAAGGDFYDAFPLDGGRVGIVIGDISGHGRDALMRTSLFRHTLRAYLDAGLEPRAALQVAGRVLDGDSDELATVIIATYDPATQLLRYASAGHPPPVFLGAPDHPPVTLASSPPIGAGVPTGLRQTTVSVPSGSAICLFTDGLIEARREEGMIGRLGLMEIMSELGREMNAEALLDRVAAEVDEVSDDMAACLFRVDGRADVELVRIEELEVRREDLVHAAAGRFLTACGVEVHEADRLVPLVRETVNRFGRAIVRVTTTREGVASEVLPGNVESLAAAGSRRTAA